MQLTVLASTSEDKRHRYTQLPATKNKPAPSGPTTQLAETSTSAAHPARRTGGQRTEDEWRLDRVWCTAMVLGSV